MSERRIKCPVCNGSGWHHNEGRGRIQIRCMWCRGAKYLSKKDALRYADQTEMLGNGGYIDGDHDYKDMIEFRNMAKAIRERCARP